MKKMPRGNKLQEERNGNDWKNTKWNRERKLGKLKWERRLSSLTCYFLIWYTLSLSLSLSK